MQLNIEQKKIIQSKPNGHILIKGVAGSGKTTVAVHKIPILLQNYCFEKDDRILVLTYNKSLVNYVNYIYEKLELEKEQEIISLLAVDDKNKLEIKTVDSIIYRYFCDYKKATKQEMRVATYVEANKILVKAIAELSKQYPDVKILKSQDFSFFRDEIAWIKACNYLELTEYQCVDRLGRMSKSSPDSPQRLLKNSDNRNAVYEVMLTYNERMKDEKLVDFQDMAIIALEYIRKNPKQKYTHILIDESQDLSRVQIEFIKQLYNAKSYSSFVFIADVAQSIYSHAWLVKGRSFASIGFDMTGKSYTLSKNYRTTTQIAEAAYSLIENDKNIVEDDNFVKPSLIDRQGKYPVYKGFNNKQDEASFVIKTINEELKQIYDFKEIAIIARTTEQLIEMERYLQNAQIPCSRFENKEKMEFGIDKVKLLTMHSIKGLEFKVVIIIGLNNKKMPLVSVSNEFEDIELIETMDRKLLYVGMTRATDLLYLTSDGVPSKFIGDISYKYLRIDSKSNIRRFHRINVEDYLFEKKIHDIYSQEEIIRQWIMRELNEVYKYPNDLLDIEYQVNLGSKIGFVDGVIYIYRNKTKVPYIFVEAKRWGTGLETGFSQIKSYMSNCNGVQYGIVTDGNEIKIINKNFENVYDIPPFSSSMLPSTVETFTYVDFKHKNKFEFIRDFENIKELIVTTETSGEEYANDELRKLVIYSEIAAGKPIEMNPEQDGEFYIPRQWIKGAENAFILKVKGDSMINAGIDDGDLVIINKQQAANNGDIVAMAIEGSATLKTFRSMGGNILLIAENEKYEPIILEGGDVSIIGVAVGLIKS